MYLSIKYAHVTFAIISISFFLVRAWWSWQNSGLLKQRWVRIAPHINDTLLLACAVYLMVTSQQFPFVNDWLTAKVIALLVYIGIGTAAIKRGSRPATIAAAICFGYMILVARSHQVWPF